MDREAWSRRQNSSKPHFTFGMASGAAPETKVRSSRDWSKWAVGGGIGANRAHPATFFHDNLMMGAQLLDPAYRHDVEKFVAIGTVCAYPKFAGHDRVISDGQDRAVGRAILPEWDSRVLVS